MGKMTEQQLKLIEFGKSIIKPNPDLTGTEWADKHFFLSPESSSIPGKWETRPWQVDILNAMTDRRAKDVVIKKPVRVGFTKLLNITHAYFIDQKPCVQLHYQPNDEEAKGYAEDEFEPMVRDNKRVSSLIDMTATRGRTKKEKISKKSYPNGYIEILGSQSDRNLNRRTAKVAVGDEIDTWKKEAGNTGDTITTMRRRTSDFWDRKNILGGKPVGIPYNPEEEMDNNTSMIDYWFQKGTQEYRWLPCPHCGTFHKFEFEDLQWEKDKDEHGRTIKHHPETAHFTCSSCDGEIYDHHKRDMDKNGEWRAENPEAMKDGVRSFAFWAMLSYSPNVTWPDIAREFLVAKKNRNMLKAFFNEVLARPFEEEFQRSDTVGFYDRREEYTAEVPEGVLVLTFGADVQKDRIELEVVGWGQNYESWGITYKIFFGDTTQPEVWEDVREFVLGKTFTHDNGDTIGIFSGCIDAGYLTTVVGDFCKPLYSRRIFAVKGSGVIGKDITTRKPGKTKNAAPVFTIGVNKAKDELSWHLTSESGAGYMHFPVDDCYNEEYFKQLGSERKLPNGRWEKTRARNEAVDVRVYAFASLKLGSVDLELLSQRGQILGGIEVKKHKKPKKRSGWMKKD